MSADLERAVRAHEQQLTAAMLQSDVPALDALLAPDLMFINHLGCLMSKQDDLQAHKSGLFNIEQINLAEEQLKLLGDTVAVVTVKAHIRGSFNGEKSENAFRFTRVWCETAPGLWQLNVAHSCLIA